LFAQILAAAAGKDCHYFYIQRLSQVAPVKKNSLPKVVVTKSIVVFCYFYGKMLQLRKYTLMI